VGPQPSTTKTRRRLGAVLAVAALSAPAGCGEDTPPPDDAAGSATPSAAQGDPDLFDYEQSRVRLRTLGSKVEGPVTMREVTYESPRGGTVTATMAEPRAGGTDVALILLHGMPDDRDDMREPAIVYACSGATTLAIDAPYARAEAGSIKLTRRDRNEQIQLITDLRRGIDLLAQEGATQVALVGLSYGASMGALLAGVDDRVGSAALLVGDGGLVAHMTDDEGEPDGLLSAASASQAEAWLEAMRPIEPLLYVGDSEAELLFLNGRHDTMVDAADAEQLHAAAGEGAEVRWYDTGHDLTAEAFRYQFEWVGEQTGLDRDRLAACVDDHGRLEQFQ
jgi:uncharacterized protein